MNSRPPTARQRLRRWLLQATARLPVPVSHRPAGPPRSVLVLRPDDLGDVLLVSPAIARLRAGLPAATVTLAVGPWAQGLLPHLPTVDHVLTIPFPGTSRLARGPLLAPYRLLWHQARALRSHRYDAALVLRPDHWWGGLLVWAAGVPVRLGYNLAEVAPFCTDVLPVPVGQHAAAQSLALVDRLLGRDGAREPLAAPLHFRVSAEQEAAAQALLAGGVEGPLVAIHPGAGNPIKQWPPERWRAVAAHLHQQAGARIVLTGSAGEAALTAAVAADLEPPPLDLAGRTDLGTLGAVFARCALVLGVDSGGLHVATATAPRTLRLYGPSDQVMFGPWGDPARHRLVRAGLSCPLCHHLDRTTPCNPDCMLAISASTVTDAALALLAQPAPPTP